jgi:hypothetical protein
MFSILHRLGIKSSAGDVYRALVYSARSERCADPPVSGLRRARRSVHCATCRGRQDDRKSKRGE